MRIEIKSIYKSYGKHKILDNISFTAESGQSIGLIGINGSGKTTLLSILAGVQKCDSGEFLVNGQNAFCQKSLLSATVGYVPQGAPLFEELSARDNLLLWYDQKTLKQEMTNGVLKMLGIPEFERKQVRKLSGGMKKRLAIGCAMAHKPPALLLDEPMSALDIPCREQVAAYLKQYQKAGGIVIIVSHDVQDLAGCDQLYLLHNTKLQTITDKCNLKDALCNL